MKERRVLGCCLPGSTLVPQPLECIDKVTAIGTAVGCNWLKEGESKWGQLVLERGGSEHMGGLFYVAIQTF